MKKDKTQAELKTNIEVLNKIKELNKKDLNYQLDFSSWSETKNKTKNKTNKKNTSQPTSDKILPETPLLSFEKKNKLLDELPKAKNIYDWVENPYFLSWKDKRSLFPRQLGIAVNLFSEYCPDCSDVEYVKNYFAVDDSLKTVFSKVQLLEYDECPRCHKKKIDFIKEGKLKDIIEIAGLAGQRSGKSLMVGIFCTYLLHKILTCDDLQSKMGLDPSTELLGTFSANSIHQADVSCWGYFKSSFTSCWWLNQYIKRLIESTPHLYHQGETFFKFRNKHVTFEVQAGNPSTLRGATRIFSVMDEIGWTAEESEKKLNANEIYKALNNSMTTCNSAFRMHRIENPDIPAPLLITTSSPRTRTDKISTLIRDITAYNKTEEAQKSPIGRMCYKLATWDINPMLPRDCEIMKQYYADDPVIAERDFGANPPMNSNCFFPELKFQAIKQLFEPTRENLINIQQENGYTYKFNEKEKQTFKNLIINTFREPVILGLDLGFNNNSTAFVIGKLQKDKINVLSVNEFIPSKTAPIDFYKLQQMIIQLIKELKVKILITDHWQSLSLLSQVASSLKIITQSYTLKYLDFLNVKNDLLNERITFPAIEDQNLISKALGETGGIQGYPFVFKDKPNSHLLYQIFSVVDTSYNSNGEEKKSKPTVTKGMNATDDLFRAFCLLDYATREQEAIMKTKQKQKKVLIGYNGGIFYWSDGSTSTS